MFSIACIHLCLTMMGLCYKFVKHSNACVDVKFQGLAAIFKGRGQKPFNAEIGLIFGGLWSDLVSFDSVVHVCNDGEESKLLHTWKSILHYPSNDNLCCLEMLESTFKISLVVSRSDLPIISHIDHCNSLYVLMFNNNFRSSEYNEATAENTIAQNFSLSVCATR